MGKRVQLKVTRMDIEYGGDSCDYDFLRITDGPSANDRTIGTYCGKQSEFKVTTSGNKVHAFLMSRKTRVNGVNHITFKPCS